MLKRIGKEFLKGVVALVVIIMLVGLIALMSLLGGVADWFMQTWKTGIIYWVLTVFLMVLSGCIVEGIRTRRRNHYDDDDWEEDGEGSRDSTTPAHEVPQRGRREAH